MFSYTTRLIYMPRIYKLAHKYAQYPTISKDTKHLIPMWCGKWISMCDFLLLPKKTTIKFSRRKKRKQFPFKYKKEAMGNFSSVAGKHVIHVICWYSFKFQIYNRLYLTTRLIKDGVKHASTNKEQGRVFRLRKIT